MPPINTPPNAPPPNAPQQQQGSGDMDPKLLDALFRQIVLHVVEDLPKELQAQIFHGERSDANEAAIMQALSAHQFQKHAKLFQGSKPGNKPSPTKSQPTPAEVARLNGGKPRPFGGNTNSQVRSIFGGGPDNSYLSSNNS